ncbi:MAG: hypothetical protein ABIJ18_05255 [archaeon]
MWKKVMVVLLIFCLMFVMTACADSISDDEEAIKTAGEVTEEVTGITEELENINEDLGG